MKITAINAYMTGNDAGGIEVSVTFDMGDLPVDRAVALVVAMLPSEVSHDASPPTPAPAASDGQASVSASTEAGTTTTPRSRRAPRTNPDASSASTSSSGDVAATDVPAATSRRRRVVEVPPAAEGPKVYSDVDLSKAASLTAEALSKLGDNGPEVVKLVLIDLGVTTTNDIPQDKREKFLADLAEEVTLAEAEKKAAA